MKVLWNRAELESQSAEMAGIHIKPERFYQTFVTSWDEAVLELKTEGYLPLD